MARLIFAWLALMLLPGVFALGVSQDYHEGQRIDLEQGETYIHHVTIQNDLPIDLPLRFTLTGEFATVNGAQEAMLSIPAKSTNTIVDITLIIPRDAEANKTYPVTYTVQPIVEGDGTVNMAVRLSDSFSIVVHERPSAWWPPYAIGAGILVVLVVAFIVGGRWARRAPRTVKQTTETKRSPVSLGRTEHDLVIAVAEMDDKTLENKLRSGEIARLAFERTKDPEIYHRVKVARGRKELLRALRGE